MAIIRPYKENIWPKLSYKKPIMAFIRPHKVKTRALGQASASDPYKFQNLVLLRLLTGLMWRYKAI